MVDVLSRGGWVGIDLPPPILVTGAPRSGTTWAGNIVGLDPNSGYIHEPFNPRCPKGRCRADFRRGFTYITQETEGPYLAPLADTLSWTYTPEAELAALRSPRSIAGMVRDMAYFRAMRRRKARVIIKDPLALFAAGWLARRFGARVLVVIRHPAAFVASLRAAGWGRVPFQAFADQPRLLEERLAPFAGEIRAAVQSPPDPIAAGSLLWNILNHHVGRLREEHPDWVFVRHEDLSRNPVERFRDVYDRLGLHFTPKVQKGIESYTDAPRPFGRVSIFSHRGTTVRNSTDNVASFRKRLTASELDRIRRLTTPVAEAFYGDDEW